MKNRPSKIQLIKDAWWLPMAITNGNGWIQKGKKKKYELRLHNEELFAFAGLYSHWIDKETGEIKNTYMILTTEANPLLAEIHNHKKRMPVVLKREEESKWLNHEPIENFAFPYSADLIAVKL
jgi:putative SOS response-associated peptidase YedK